MAATTQNDLTEPMLPQEKTAKRKLLQASCLCALFMVVEIVCGYLANSLALMTDAAHLLSDLASFMISYFALSLLSLPGNCEMSFGYHRAEILGACFSVACIWFATGWLVYEAILRLINPTPVDGRLMFVTALFGTVANLFMTFILSMHTHSPFAHDNLHHDCEEGGHHHHKTSPHAHTSSVQSPRLTTASTEDEVATIGQRAADVEPTVVIPTDEKAAMSLRAAYIHTIGDLLQNIGVLVASILLWVKPEWSRIDPICTLAFSMLVAYTTISIIKEAINVLMEGTPTGISLAALRKDFETIPRVKEVHDLHVWSLSVGKPAMSCHLIVEDESTAQFVLHNATRIAREKHGILHTTIQTDLTSDGCETEAHAMCHAAGDGICC
eukprot:GHVP01063036.1.p1 GENE.GHVP01063036.1~~GHVP01063036.1.p1  ORF type:complete len:383 (+),score=45.21 GHVP01063036.1:1363-2511(+)